MSLISLGRSKNPVGSFTGKVTCLSGVNMEDTAMLSFRGRLKGLLERMDRRCEERQSGTTLEMLVVIPSIGSVAWWDPSRGVFVIFLSRRWAFLMFVNFIFSRRYFCMRYFLLTLLRGIGAIDSGLFFLYIISILLIELVLCIAYFWFLFLSE